MALFFPEWIPWWLQLGIVGIVVIFGFCLLLMPFSVFGLKSRLTYLDHQMEDIQSQLRVLLKRIPDARERLEFKLQPVVTGDDEVVREGSLNKSEKHKSFPSEYYAAVPTAKNRPTRFDPPSPKEEVPPVRNPDKTIGYEERQQYSAPVRDRETVTSVHEERNINSERREDQIYNPPQTPKEDRREQSQPRRRAEPILRWPPR